jgi:hypothetical protein
MTRALQRGPDDCLVAYRMLDARVTYASFLLADVRLDLVRKAGFNSDQPRDDRGRWVDTGAGGYGPDKPGWHDYTAGPNVVCTAEERCTAQEIADQLSRFAVPGQNPAIPSRNGTTNPVYDPITGIYAGDVETEISQDGLTVRNTTKENHILHDGQITRSATQNPDGSWSVTTRGIGNNATPGMNVANQYGGPVIFDILDERMRENIRVHHGSRKSLDDWDHGHGYRRGPRNMSVGLATGGAHGV